MNEQALQDYRDAISNNLLLQIAILVLALPMLFIFVSRGRKERKARRALMAEMEKTDRTYVFNPGNTEVSSEERISERSIQNVRQAGDFIQSMAGGNYDVEWSGLTNDNSRLNKNTLAGNLLELRNRLRQVKQEDDRRNWSNEGLAQFSEIVRNHQHSAEELHLKCVSYLTKYLKAQQGSLFIREAEPDDLHLKLVACYAFDRKKWIEKRIEIGQGILGQAYLEGEPVKLKTVPKDYISIRSGLGEATPTSLVIVPMKYNGETLAIVEIATFHDLEDHHIAFLQKAGEFLASAIVNTHTTAKMKNLLEEATIKEEQMRQREEELRQNMEELQATQEELVRRQRENEVAQAN